MILVHVILPGKSVKSNFGLSVEIQIGLKDAEKWKAGLSTIAEELEFQKSREKYSWE